MLLTESKLTEVLTEGLRYHLDTKTPLYENVYRPGSENYFSTIKQARHLLNKGVLTELCLEDMELLFETEVGEYGIYEEQKVPLDFPMVENIVVTEPQTTEYTQAWNAAKQNQTILTIVNTQAQKKNMEPYNVWLDLASKGKAAGGAAYTIDIAAISQYITEEEESTETDVSAVMPIVAEYKEDGTKKYQILTGTETYRELQGSNADVWVVDLTIYQEGTVSEYKDYDDNVMTYLATWANIFDKMLEHYKAGSLDTYIESLSGTARKAADAFKSFIEKNAKALTEAKLDTDQKKHIVRKLMRAASSAAAEKNIAQILDDIEKQLANTSKADKGYIRYVDGVRVDEAKYQGKKVKLNKPQRGGSKKFFVYTKNPKTGKVVKVSFGGTTGLKAKINNAEARKSFAARHNCATKKDKTKSGYWSCRLPRYASLLGLKSSFGGYW